MGLYQVIFFYFISNNCLACRRAFEMLYSLCDFLLAGSSEQESETEINLPFVKSPNPVMALVCEFLFIYASHYPCDHTM